MDIVGNEDVSRRPGMERGLARSVDQILGNGLDTSRGC